MPSNDQASHHLPPAQTVLMSAVLSGLSAALDVTEGHPAGHAARACLIGMRLVRALELPPDDASDVFYGLLLKDAGCSSNAGRVFQMFGGPEHATKRAVWLRDWRRLSEQVRYAIEAVEPGGSLPSRLQRLAGLGLGGHKASRELFEIRCERGAEIARALGCSEGTARGVLTMDEHWDGGGHPRGLRHHDIPLAGRIIGLAQVVEIFWELGGPDRALEVAHDRSGRWFDPELVRCLRAIASDDLWRTLHSHDLAADVAAAEPQERVVVATEARLDAIARAFAWVIDAKSTFTYRHSERVADIAVRILGTLGSTPAERTRIARAGLLHDIGKLAVPNSILDKPGRLTGGEWAKVREHPFVTFQILDRVPVFRGFADDASNHHERLDGRGYFRGLPGERLSRTARVLAVADVVDALASDRPYRAAMDVAMVCATLEADRGTALCPEAVDAAAAVLRSA